MELTILRDDVFKPLREQQQQLVEAWNRIRRYFPETNEPENELAGIPTADKLYNI